MTAGADFWTPARIARDHRVTVQAVERAAASAGVRPAYTVNCIPYFDDAGREAIDRSLAAATPAGMLRTVPPANDVRGAARRGRGRE
jgi:hypothetical protein